MSLIRNLLIRRPSLYSGLALKPLSIIARYKANHINDSIRYFGASFGKKAEGRDSLLEKTILPKLTGATQGDVHLKSALRCLVFDGNGDYRRVAADEERVMLINRRDLLPRDLRKIDKGYNNIVPSILIRENSILMSLLHITALIKADSIVLFNYYGSYADKKFVRNLADKLKNTSGDKLHYEVRALEAIFMDVIENLNSEMKVHVNVVKGILKELEDDVDLPKLKYLLIVSKKLQQFQQKATLMRDLIDELLDQDDELAEMYLTEKKEGLPRSPEDHQEVELLLESYSLHCDAIVQTVENANSDVKTTEEIVNIILDSNRNDLMLLGLRFSAGLMSIGSLLFVASVYGMNLRNFFETNEQCFSVVTVASLALTFLLFRFAMRHLSRLQKIQLMKRHV